MLIFQQKELFLKDYLSVLKKCPLFSDIEDQNLLVMLDCLGAKTSFYDKKRTVFSEGTLAKKIGIVLSGSVQLEQNDYYGNRTILGNITASQVFVEEFACLGTIPLPLSAITTEPSEIMLIDCDHILHTCSNNCGFHQQLIFNLMKDLATKTILFHQRIEITSKRSTREKLIAYLTMQAKKANSNRFEIPFDRQELADYLEVDRSGLSAELSKMKKEGILDYHKNHFVLP